ncbi:hypothetical protein HBB16_01360 [Pseudonocardia sp. MCCB 268]|nr:hypothetical protein [Pseudonocardia cytotoxica]
MVSLFAPGAGIDHNGWPAGHRRRDAGAVGGGAAVPATGVDGVADPRAVRRDRPGRRRRSMSKVWNRMRGPVPGNSRPAGGGARHRVRVR